MRELDAPSCAAAVSSVALVLGMLGPHEEPRDVPEPVAAPPRPARDVRAIAGATVTSDRLYGALLGVRVARFGAELAVARTQVDFATISSIDAALVACLDRDSFAACGVVAGGAIRARGRDVLQPGTGLLPQLAVGVRAEWISPSVSIFALAVRAEVDVNVLKDRFQINDMDVWHAAPLAGRPRAGRADSVTNAARSRQ